MKLRFSIWVLTIYLIGSVSLYAAGPPYVILISLDGFRWDYIERGITPNLQRLTDNGVSASSLMPVFPTKTFPTHYSIVTGLHPDNHGIISNSFFDPQTGERFALGLSEAIQDAKWYQGEAVWETLERNGIRTASYFWPGSELNLEYRRPSYFHHYDHDRPHIDRVDGVVGWLSLPVHERPQFITLYFHDVDSEGHRTGPYSDETNRAIALVDSVLGILIHRLEEIDMLDKTNIIVVSDHGMTEVTAEKVIDLGEILDGFDVLYEGFGPVTMIMPEESEIDAVYMRLKENEGKYKVYKKEYIPGYLHYSSHAFILPLVVIAEMGWSLIEEAGSLQSMRYVRGGNHGYENTHLDMHGIFNASGPAFRKGYRTGTVKSIDIYPLICEIFGIRPRDTIDGDLNRIRFILEER
jgi:ectonucleotide pyrophosphatase/phosphodiesterase family member 5